MASNRKLRMERWSLVRPGHLDVVVGEETTVEEIPVATTVAETETAVVEETVTVDPVTGDVTREIVIQMTGRRDVRRTGHQASRMTNAEMTVIEVILVIIRAINVVGVVEAVMIEGHATMTATVSVKKRMSELNLFNSN
jgi:hypothetical protein